MASASKYRTCSTAFKMFMLCVNYFLSSIFNLRKVKGGDLDVRVKKSSGYDAAVTFSP